MDKNSRILFFAFFVLILISVAATYYRYIVARDYVIEAQGECDPYSERCFVHVCNPEEEECAEGSEEDTSYYKLIHRNAKNIPFCDPLQKDCDVSMCSPDEEDCAVTLCDAMTVEEGTTCIDPTVYSAQHPASEIDFEEEPDEVDNAENDGTAE